MHTEIRFAPVALAEADALSDALNEVWAVDVTAIAMVETSPGRWAVTAYVADAADTDLAELVVAPLKARLGALPGTEIVAGEDRDWVAEGLKDLKPVAAGRFLVHGTHDRGALRPGLIGIEIDAGEAFGTGHHGTTAGCLEVLETLRKTNKRFNRALDLGTGSGVLAIAIAKALRTVVVATDIDARATDVAAANARLNGVAPLVRVGTGAGTRIGVVRDSAPFDLILANILARPLVGLAPEIAAVAAPGGRLVLSGLLEAQVPPVRAAFEARGFGFRSMRIREGWATLILARDR